uniref:ORF79 n=1 Tax=Phytophthora infestans TaxID=4787 RepID=Q9T258_PHYIN|nr:orf79 [Phytophthora infestans]AAF24771.1 orf79 [Phytophthora infestans]AAW62541.1 orf79 [Phytophthora infestans]AAW67027.1 ORF79 [Phytophthora infestans]AAW67111.1 ORF79 [Phytophthora infestans]ADK36707.1 unknown [Phytophthora infestans]
MQKKLKILFLFLFLSISISILILYLHNVLPYINLKIIFLLLKNRINIFTLCIDDDHFHPRYISSGDFNLLITELSEDFS